MKNVSLIINAVLFVAVAVLFYLHFASPSVKKAVADQAVTDLKVAYVSTDTLIKYFEYVKDNKDIFEAKGKRLQKDLSNRATTLQSEIESYQRNRANLTIVQANAIEEDLGKKQQNLQLFQQRIEQELMNDQDKMTREIYEKLTGYLKTYSADNGIQVVFKYDQTSDMLYGANVLDISKAVVDGMNEQYRKDKGTTVPAPKDTTATKKK